MFLRRDMILTDANGQYHRKSSTLQLMIHMFCDGVEWMSFPWNTRSSKLCQAAGSNRLHREAQHGWSGGTVSISTDHRIIDIFVGFALAFKGWVPDLRVKMIREWRPNTRWYNLIQRTTTVDRKFLEVQCEIWYVLQEYVKVFQFSVPGCMPVSLCIHIFVSHIFWTEQLNIQHPGGCSRFVQRQLPLHQLYSVHWPLGLTEGRSSGGHNVGVLQRDRWDRNYWILTQQKRINSAMRSLKWRVCAM